jgi:hypothetical protein
MDFYAIEPEVAGELGEGTVMDTSVHPPRVSAVEYVITDWLGDDIIESYPDLTGQDRPRLACTHAFAIPWRSGSGAAAWMSRSSSCGWVSHNET